MNERELERSLKALANRRRLGILGRLKKNGEATVGDLARGIHLSIRATSRHLGILFAANIVEKDQRGLLVFYRLRAVQLVTVHAVLGSV